MWAKTWNLTVASSLLPKTGRIVPGKAAIFLYKTDSDVGFIENLICNKEVDKQSASEAIDACVTAIEKDAKTMGIKVLHCSTTIFEVAKRASLTHGYLVQNAMTMSKVLV